MAKTKVNVKPRHTYKNAWQLLGFARILVGFVFLWAFVDKTFGLGVATKAKDAWINGVSPTTGFYSTA